MAKRIAAAIVFGRFEGENKSASYTYRQLNKSPPNPSTDPKTKSPNLNWRSSELTCHSDTGGIWEFLNSKTSNAVSE